MKTKEGFFIYVHWKKDVINSIKWKHMDTRDSI